MSETSHYLLIRTPEVKSITLNGAILGEINGLQSENLELILTGATSIAAHAKVKFLDAYITSASQQQLTGGAQQFKIKLVGACNLDASSFNTKTTYAYVTGASTAHIHTEDFLNIDAAGVSTIIYAGTANTELQRGLLRNIIKQ